MKTASWFTEMPDGHVKIGTSRGVPRYMKAGYRLYKKLAPGPWFNSCATNEEYDRLYQKEILGPLDPRVVVAELNDLAGGHIPVLVCYEAAPMRDNKWCHRALIGEWLHNELGILVPELGFEQLAQADHPLMAEDLRRPSPPTKSA